MAVATLKIVFPCFGVATLTFGLLLFTFIYFDFLFVGKSSRRFLIICPKLSKK